MVFHWTCPFCDRDTTIRENDLQKGNFDLTKQNAEGTRRFDFLLIICPNPKCRKFVFHLVMKEYFYKEDLRDWTVGKTLQEWNLIPPSQAKVFPDYVPKPIRDDYLEACLIRD